MILIRLKDNLFLALPLENKIKIIRFCATFIPTKTIYFDKMPILANKQNYFYKEKILKINDLIYSFCYIFRKKKFNKQYPKFNNFDLSKLVFDDKKSQIFSCHNNRTLHYVFTDRFFF